MRRFTRLYLDLDATNASGEKLDLLEAYFRDVPPADGAWALALLAGNRPKRGASSRALVALVVERTGTPDWLLSECHQAVGDFAETAALLLPEGGAGSDEPLHETIERRVIPLAGADDAARARLIAEAWDAFDTDQRFVFHKLIRGGFRVGVQTRSVARALARVAGVDPGVMAHRLTGGAQPTPHAFRAVLAPEGEADDHAKPYPFFLAHQLDDPPHTLGDIDDWRAEWKWDGVRAQLIHRPPSSSTPERSAPSPLGGGGGERSEPGAGNPPKAEAGPADTAHAVLWSRGEELITRQFPEIINAAQRLPPCVLDGEVLLIESDRPRPFAELQTRLNRKTAPAPQLGLFEAKRIVFMAFDVLEVEGEDLRARPFHERRAALERLLDMLPPDASIRPSPPVQARTWEDLAALREQSRARAVEGVMLKHAQSVYGVGRTKPGEGRGWWKWKIDPHTVDCVLTFAQPGSGRRASLFTDYTFGVWHPEGDGRRLVTFAKAYSGLTNEEIERLDAWIRRHTRKTMGPVREVEPVHVFELGFEAIRPSDRHKSGVAVRFPRILRWRTDKRPEDADTLASLKKLANAHP